MTNSENRAKVASAAIAQVRKSINNFSLKELAIELKKAGCPYASNVASDLLAKGLVSGSKKRYTFSTNEPIHFRLLIQGLDRAASSAKKYLVNCYSKKVQSSNEMTELEMISFLKEKGYKILKPITKFEEC